MYKLKYYLVWCVINLLKFNCIIKWEFNILDNNIWSIDLILFSCNYYMDYLMLIVFNDFIWYDVDFCNEFLYDLMLIFIMY